MTKYCFENIFSAKTEEVKNVVITTNIAKGLGINGVDYTQFNTYLVYENPRDNSKKITKTEIIMHEEYVEFDLDIKYFSTYCNKDTLSKQLINKCFVPYENIVSISFAY